MLIEKSNFIYDIQDDFERFAWTIVFLAMGGIALGNGVMSSGLLEVMDVIIRNLIADLTLYSVVMILSVFVLVSEIPPIRLSFPGCLKVCAIFFLRSFPLLSVIQ